MTDTTVKHFDSTMTGAPTLANVAGNLLAVLDACLVDGFGLKTVDSLVVASGDRHGNDRHGPLSAGEFRGVDRRRNALGSQRREARHQHDHEHRRVRCDGDHGPNRDGHDYSQARARRLGEGLHRDEQDGLQVGQRGRDGPAHPHRRCRHHDSARLWRRRHDRRRYLHSQVSERSADGRRRLHPEVQQRGREEVVGDRQ